MALCMLFQIDLEENMVCSKTLMFKLIQYISFKLFMQLGLPYAIIITLISYL